MSSFRSGLESLVSIQWRKLSGRFDSSPLRLPGTDIDNRDCVSGFAS